MKQFAVVGKDITYSLSPIIHQTNFDALGINASYQIIDIGNISQEIAKLRHLSGFNITIPYKEDLMSYCVALSQEAQAIGAINTVDVRDGKWYGYNTDCVGFYELLKKHHLHKLDNQPKIMIIGAGGASKAVYYTLTEYCAYQNVYLTNRTRSKAEVISSKVIDLETAEEELASFDMVINATNVGVKQYQTPIKIDKVKTGSVFIDLNYQKELKFLQDSQKKGAKTIDGLVMLIHQAGRAFEIWFQQEADINSMKQIMRKELE